jgi:hypothetical protein
MGSCPLRGISFGSLLRSALGLNTHLLALLVHYPFDFLLIDDEASLLFESDACLLASIGWLFSLSFGAPEHVLTMVKTLIRRHASLE